MPTTPLSPATQRILACLHAFAHEEDGAAGHDDWPALVGILERETQLLARLAQEKPTEANALKPHAEKLSQRLNALSQRIETARVRDAHELANLGETTQRMHAVRKTYFKA